MRGLVVVVAALAASCVGGHAYHAYHAARPFGDDCQAEIALSTDRCSVGKSSLMIGLAAGGDAVRRYAGFNGTALQVMPNPDDAQDIAQECFLELERESDSVISFLPGCLNTIARHRSINVIRNASRCTCHEGQTTATRETQNADPRDTGDRARPTPDLQARRWDIARTGTEHPGVPVGGLGTWKAGPSTAAPAGDAVLDALSAKAAAIRDYHYRLEWTTAEGAHVSAVEVWYAGPRRMRIVQTDAGQRLPWAEVVLKGDDIYRMEPSKYEVMKSRVAQARRHVLASGLDSMGPVYLSGEVLALWPRAEVTGAEAVGGVSCHAVDVIYTRGRLSGDLVLDLEDFVAFVPRTGESQAEGFRFWADGDTGMLRRWGALAGSQVRPLCEVTETQTVNGFPFPSLLRRGDGMTQQIGRVTEVTINEGMAEGVLDFRSPPNWLMRDGTLTEAEVRERLLNDPDDADLHYTLGRLLRPNDEDAAEEFRRAAELAPDSPTPLLALADALQWRRLLSSVAPADDGQTAIVDALREATARADDDGWELRKRLAKALGGADTLDEAIAEYRKLMAAGPPRSHSVAGALAGLLARKGDHEGAFRVAADVPITAALWQHPPAGIVDWAAKCDRLDDLRAKLGQATAEYPESPQLWLLLAQALQAQGRGEDAVEAFKRVPLTFYPAAVMSLSDDLGEKEWAVAQVRPAVRQALESRQVWVINNLLHEEELRPTVTAEFRREAAAVWTETTDVHSRVTLLDVCRRAGEGMYRAGLGQLALDPDEMTPAECAIMAAADFELSMLGHRTRDLRRHAEECLHRALTEWPDDGALCALLGKLHWWQQQWDGVAKAYLKAAAADPEQIEYPARAAFALARVGRCDQALDVGRKAIEAWPEEWAAQAFFAALQMDCGEFAAARKALLAVRARPEVQHSSHEQREVTHLLDRCRRLRAQRAGAMAAQGNLAAAKALGDEVRAEAGTSPDAWGEVAETYLAAQSWDDALVAAGRMSALTLAGAVDEWERIRMRADILAARAYAGKRDDHEARRRLIPILARAQDPGLLREAAEALVGLYLVRGKREQAIATLSDLRVRTQDGALHNWIDQRLKEVGGG